MQAQFKGSKLVLIATSIIHQQLNLLEMRPFATKM